MEICIRRPDENNLFQEPQLMRELFYIKIRKKYHKMTFLITINQHFANKRRQMQETRKNNKV